MINSISMREGSAGTLKKLNFLPRPRTMRTAISSEGSPLAWGTLGTEPLGEAGLQKDQTKRYHIKIEPFNFSILETERNIMSRMNQIPKTRLT